MIQTCLSTTAAVLIFSALTSAARAAEPVVRFNRDVRPILSDNCLACHGPDSTKRKAGLRLDTKDGLFAKAEHDVFPVVPGKPGESEIIRRINAADPDDLMPPKASHKSLTAAQKDVLRRWVEQGAAWEPHWSFVAPVQPELPEVKRPEWVRNPIDRFVLARLEAEKLDPAPEADRRTLIRRVYLDLVGLPPPAAEVEAFVLDNSPDAYEKLVDRLLASPHYGEHRARYWLDYARYADTHGLHHDDYREMWPYRDWVINAFNQNLPFDRFTIEQLAGDLLPQANLDDQIASGFNRCNITTAEGGSIAEEVEAMYAKDRVETTATVWLGLTAGCAVCHDHKFDPVAQKEFYRLVAFFRNTTQPAMDGNIPDTPPVVVVPQTPADREQWFALDGQAKRLKEQRQAERSRLAAAFDAWAKSCDARDLRQPIDGSQQHLDFGADEGDGATVAVIDGKQRMLDLPQGLTWGEGPNEDAALRFGEKAVFELPNAGDLDADRPFSLGGWVFVPPEGKNFVVAAKLDQASGQGWVLEVANRTFSFRMNGGGDADVLQVGRDAARLQPGKWNHVVVTYDGGRKADGLTIYVNAAPTYAAADGTPLQGSVQNAAPLRFGADGKRADVAFKGGGLQSFRIDRRAFTAEEVTSLMKWPGLRRALLGDARLADAQRQDLLTLYVNRFDNRYRQASVELADAERGQRGIRRRSPVTHVMQEKAGSQPAAHVLYRGQYDQPRDKVEPATPAVLHAWPDGAPRNRLGLAQWLVRPENPLTARVTVNRFWQEMFGTGLVATPGDFGIMGETPSHPELLEWLAVEFRESGWDMKKLVRTIVTSAAYRQACALTPQKLAKDPNNRLLSRGPRYRLDAETLRDAALAEGGLLVPKIGGPSVKPYQPPGVWEAVAMFDSNTRFYKPDRGEALYRRSLYTFWKRSAPPASMEIFNAPSRENCTVRRERTDTPVQALVTMNDPQWVEAARNLAERALREAPDDFDRRLDYLTTRVVARPFDARERQVCCDALAKFQSAYRADGEAAKKLIAVGESKADAKLPPADLAAWTMLASQLMNLDEALTK